MFFKIKWGNSLNKFYLYGSKIIKESSNSIYFENSLLPPGTAILEWDSSKNNMQQLPLLKRGMRYSIIPKLKVDPQNSIFIKVNFYNRIGDLVGTENFDLPFGDFIYPFDAYYYTIGLVNTSLKDLYFEYIIITTNHELKYFHRKG